MVQGSPEDPPDDLDEERPEEGPVLSPDELDISSSEYVEKIDEGRFVVSPHQRTPKSPAGTTHERSSGSEQSQNPPDEVHTPSETERSSQSHPQHPQTHTDTGELTQEDIHRWLRRDFEQHSSRYAFDVTATFDGTVSQRRMASNDVVTIFESLLLWYAQQVDNDTPVEEILGILLLESNVPVRYPPESVQNLVRSTDLGPDDTIADLLKAIQDDGVQL